MGRFWIKRGESIRLTLFANVLLTVVARARVRYDDGKLEDFSVADVTSSGSRESEGGNSGSVADRDGEVVGITVYARTDINVARGDCYASLSTALESDPYVKLASGYVYTGHGLALGEFDDAGEGRGNLRWLAVAADIAPVDATQLLALSNMRRRVCGFVWYYNCAAVVATRTMQVFLENRGPARPTGISAGGANTAVNHWASSAVSLTTGEEGQIYAMHNEGDGYTIMNDNGTITPHSTATNPNPFPLDVEPNDDAQILFDVGSADAGDRHSIYILLEEWVIPDG